MSESILINVACAILFVGIFFAGWLYWRHRYRNVAIAHRELTAIVKIRRATTKKYGVSAILSTDGGKNWFLPAHSTVAGDMVCFHKAPEDLVRLIETRDMIFKQAEESARFDVSGKKSEAFRDAAQNMS